MNSQSWLTTYLTLKSSKFLLLKCLKGLESCLFRQGSELLWATPWSARAPSLQGAARGSWEGLRQGNNWTPGGWKLPILAPNPSFPRALQVHKLHAVALQIQPRFPHPLPNPPRSAPSSSHPCGSLLAGPDLSDRIFGTGSMFYCHKRWLESRFPSHPTPLHVLV